MRTVEYKEKCSCGRILWTKLEYYDLMCHKCTEIMEKRRGIGDVYDQYYTDPNVASELVRAFLNYIPYTSNINTRFVEPSAGTGNFVKALIKYGIKKEHITSYDIDPKGENITKLDYLKNEFKYAPNKVVIGNPPFGERGNTAIKFLNKALQEAPFVAFIMPNTLKRYSAQKKVLPNARLIYSKDVGKNAFIYLNEPHNVRCVFQIWTTGYIKTDLRITKPYSIKHPDFETWIHNNTKNTLKFFDKKKYGWDIAVHRQGYYDYSKLITNEDELIKNRQYFFIKTKNWEVLELIKKIDFVKLSKTNTQTPGFSTTDFVKAYKKLKEEK